MVTADRRFFSAKNEREAEALGVEKVAWRRTLTVLPIAADW
jgi:hypothetical protein